MKNYFAIIVLLLFVFAAGFFLGRSYLLEKPRVAKMIAASPSSNGYPGMPALLNGQPLAAKLQTHSELDPNKNKALMEASLTDAQKKLLPEFRKLPRSAIRAIYDDVNEEYWQTVSKSNFRSPETEEEVKKQKDDLWNGYNGTFQEEKYFQAKTYIQGKKERFEMHFVWQQGIDAIDEEGNFKLVAPTKNIKPDRMAMRISVYRTHPKPMQIASAWERIGYFAQSAGKFFSTIFIFDNIGKEEGIERLAVELPHTASASAEFWLLRLDGDKWERLDDLDWSPLSKEEYQELDKEYNPPVKT